MGLGKWLVVVGLMANIIGTFLVGWVAPQHSVPIVSSTGPATRAASIGVPAHKYRWGLLAFGFTLQLVGTVLWT